MNGGLPQWHVEYPPSFFETLDCKNLGVKRCVFLRPEIKPIMRRDAVNSVACLE